MAKTRLFIKLIVLYFCIMFSTLTMLGILLSFLINNYFIYNKQMEMVIKSSNISNLAKPYLMEKHDPQHLLDYLNSAEKNLGTEIYVVDRNGYMIAGEQNNEMHEGELIDPEDIEEMQQGKTNIRQGKSHSFDEKALWVTTPVIDNNKVIGGIILYSPIIGIKQATEKVRNLFIYSALVSTLFSAIVVHFMAKYVTSPLRQMNKVAKKIAQGDFSERVVTKQDDEIGDLSEAFNYMASQIERQERMRRDFVADVSHELKSPLTNIQGFVEALADGKDKNEQDRIRYLGIVHKETLRLIRLVNELLDLSRIDAGGIEFEKNPVNIINIIKSSVLKIMPVIKENHREVEVNLPKVPLMVVGNHDRLEQVILNLIDNANRYSPPGRKIAITVEQKNNEVEVFVIDNGKGIPGEELPMIWERFYKVDKSRCRETGGTGLGLAIVKQIIESFGGKVMAESELGKGTKIGFSLPLAVSAE